MPRRRDPEPLTFELSEVISQFYADYSSGSQRTLGLYQYRVGIFQRWCDAHGLVALGDITPDHLRKLFEEESQRTYERGGTLRPISPTSTVQLQSSIARFFSWCIEQEYLASSPMEKVRRLPQPILAARAFEREECTRLIREAARADGWLARRDRALVTFMLDTGARIGEVVKLTPRHFDWPRRRVLLNGKGLKDRWVPLGTKATKSVRDYLAVRPKIASERVWATTRGTPLNGPSLDMMLRNLGRYANVEHVHAHRFRHTYATEWYQRHHDIMALKNLLGHSKVETTQKYLRSLGIEYGTGNEYTSPGDFI